MSISSPVPLVLRIWMKVQSCSRESLHEVGQAMPDSMISVDHLILLSWTPLMHTRIMQLQVNSKAWLAIGMAFKVISAEHYALVSFLGSLDILELQLPEILTSTASGEGFWEL